MHSGVDSRLPYSLSRWTDVPAAKWDWFKRRLELGWMEAIHPRTGVPKNWSLAAGEELVFWTKDPRNILQDRELLRGYKVTLHVTVTGWSEMELGAPSLEEGSELLKASVEAFGAENVRWRFSPIPVASDAVERFSRILSVAKACGLTEVFTSFIQTNDRLVDPRSPSSRKALLQSFAQAAQGFNVRLCNEDTLLHGKGQDNLSSGICAPTQGESEPCGCGLMVDPFTINESCSFGCLYCYAGSKATTRHKRDTTKLLKQV